MKKLKGQPAINSSDEIQGLDPDEFSVFLIEFDRKNNVRLQYDETALKELAESIRSEGQLQPVGVERKRNENQRHHLVYGYRRFIAITDHLNRDKIRVVFVDGDNRDVVQLTENIHRSDLSDLEIARSLLAIKERTGETNAELAKRLNKSEDWIKDKIFHAKTIDSLAVETVDDSGGEAPSEGVPAHPEVENLTTSHVRETRGLDDGLKREILRDAAENKRTAKDVRKRVNTAKSESVRKEVEKKASGLSEKDRKRGEKLALHLKTLRATREKLEGKLKSVKEDEKKTLKELKSIGQPELFGVES